MFTPSPEMMVALLKGVLAIVKDEVVRQGDKRLDVTTPIETAPVPHRGP